MKPRKKLRKQEVQTGLASLFKSAVEEPIRLPSLPCTQV